MMFDGTQPVCDGCGVFNTKVVCMDCARELVKKEIVREIRNKKFPIGEREWCKECGDRIADCIEGVI